jgi:serine/threonine-protein kinase
LPQETSHRWPQVLPGSQTVVYTAFANDYSLAAFSMRTGQQKTLVRGASFGRYLRSGHLIYVAGETLMAVKFDAAALTVTGEAVPILALSAASVDGSAQLDVSNTGVMAYRPESGGRRQVVLLEEDNIRTLPLKPRAYGFPRFSPDGRRLALEVLEGAGRDVWTYDIDRDRLTRLTYGAGRGLTASPFWSPDGRFILFPGPTGLLTIRSDGSGKPASLTHSTNLQTASSFTPDGRYLTWNETGEGNYDLWIAPVDMGPDGLKAGKPEPLLNTSSDERSAKFSPDGRWFAYTSDESGTYQVYVRAYPDKGGRWQVSAGGGSYPLWSTNGREMFFRADNQIMVMTYEIKGDSFLPGKARLWSQQRLVSAGAVGLGTYDMSPDGKRAVGLVPQMDTDGLNDQVVFLLNFFDELRRRVR